MRATAGAHATTRRPSGRHARTAADLVLFADIALATVIIFWIPVFLHYRLFPVGPDVPVYLWWTRVGAFEGLSVAGERPGAPALIGTLSGALGLGLVPALGGLQYALGPAIATAGAALLRGRGSIPRPAWFAGGLLTGVWATHLGDGYVSNLIFAAAFLAGAAALARRRRRTTIAAAILLGGGGLAHPQFFVFGVAILLVSAAWAVIRERRLSIRAGDAGRVLAALVGGALIVGVGLLAAAGGSPTILGDTSKDAYLRRTGQWASLRASYLDRFHDSWRRYAPVMNGILTAGGATHARGYAQRFLLAWIALTAIAVPVGAFTGAFPPDRILTFAFCIPLLAAVGLLWLGRKLRWRALAYPVGIVLVVLTALPTLRVWVGTNAYVSAEELRGATLAGRIARTLPPGTPLVFVAVDPEDPGLFLASHALNVARAAVPPDRVRDVYVFVGEPADLLAGRPSTRGVPAFDRASADSFAAIPQAPAAVVFVVADFVKDPAALAAPGLTRWDPVLASTAPGPRTLPAEPSELAPSSPEGFANATARVFATLLLVGFGWAWWAMRDLPGAAASAAAFGIAVLSLAGVALERLGLGFGSPGVSALAVALAGGGGYALLFVRLLREREDRGRRLLAAERQADPHA